MPAVACCQSSSCSIQTVVKEKKHQRSPFVRITGGESGPWWKREGKKGQKRASGPLDNICHMAGLALLSGRSVLTDVVCSASHYSHLFQRTGSKLLQPLPLSRRALCPQDLILQLT